MSAHRLRTPINEILMEREQKRILKKKGRRQRTFLNQRLDERLRDGREVLLSYRHPFKLFA